MSNPFVAEIRIFAGNFNPRGWATCDGQLLPISQNTALFSLLGTFYGGDGRSTFALPDLQDRVPMHWGSGPGLSPRDLGEVVGEETVTLLGTENAVHQHALVAGTAPATSGNPIQPDGTPVSLARSRGGNAYVNPPPTQTVAMAQQSVAPVGGGQPHNNMQSYLGLTFIIALQGVFPPRS